MEAICAAVERHWGAFVQMHHWTSNLVIDLDNDQARGEVDVSVTTQFADGTWLRGGGVDRDAYARQVANLAKGRRAPVRSGPEAQPRCRRDRPPRMSPSRSEHTRAVKVGVREMPPRASRGPHIVAGLC